MWSDGIARRLLAVLGVVGSLMVERVGAVAPDKDGIKSVPLRTHSFSQVSYGGGVGKLAGEQELCEGSESNGGKHGLQRERERMKC